MLSRLSILVLISLVPVTAAHAEWSGSFGLRGYGWASRPADPALTPAGGVELNLEGKGDIGESGRWNFSPWILAAGPSDPDEAVQFEPTQAYLQLSAGSRKTRIGFQTFAWEGTDLVNPFDMAQARNYRDPFNIRTRPSLALWHQIERGAWQAEFIYIPRATPPLLPGDRSPWWPRQKVLPLDSQKFELRLPTGVEYRLLEGETLNNALDNNIAIRLIRRGENGDFSIAVFDGLANDPSVGLGDTTLKNPIQVDPIVIAEPEGAVELRPANIRWRAAAAGFNYAFSKGVFRWAGRTQQPLGDDVRVPAWSSLNVFSWEQNVSVRERDWTLLFEIFSVQRSEEEQVSFLRSIFDRACAIGARIPVTDDMEIYAGGVYDSIGKSSLARFSWKQRWSDNWSSDLDINSLSGPPDTLLGVFQDYDRVDLTLRRSF